MAIISRPSSLALAAAITAANVLPASATEPKATATTTSTAETQVRKPKVPTLKSLIESFKASPDMRGGMLSVVEASSEVVGESAPPALTQDDVEKIADQAAAAAVEKEFERREKEAQKREEEEAKAAAERLLETPVIKEMVAKYAGKEQEDFCKKLKRKAKKNSDASFRGSVKVAKKMVCNGQGAFLRATVKDTTTVRLAGFPESMTTESFERQASAPLSDIPYNNTQRLSAVVKVHNYCSKNTQPDYELSSIETDVEVNPKKSCKPKPRPSLPRPAKPALTPDR